VDTEEADLDAVFKALADRTRRLVLDRLRERGGLTLNELCERLEMTRQAVSKHVSILEDAGLVATRRSGREKLHYLNPVPINDIYTRWISKYERDRLTALATLKAALEEGDSERRPSDGGPPGEVGDRS
jgi:DNA-binding transcriptional ArsR family regulator